MSNLRVLLDLLEAHAGPADPLPSTDGWELVLAENVAYLADDQRRWQALDELRRQVGLAPEQILAAPESVLAAIVAGPRPADRVQRLRRCAELTIAGAPWRAYPGIGAPGADRIDLFTSARAVLALDANAMRVLARLGVADPARSYATSYREAQAAASAQLPASVPALQCASQLLRRHGQAICKRKGPDCPRCPIAAHCPSAGHPPLLYLIGAVFSRTVFDRSPWSSRDAPRLAEQAWILRISTVQKYPFRSLISLGVLSSTRLLGCVLRHLRVSSGVHG